MDLSQENHDALVYAVKNHYWYQMYIGRFLYHDTLSCIYSQCSHMTYARKLCLKGTLQDSK